MCIPVDIQYRNIKYVDSNRLFDSLVPIEDDTITQVFLVVFILNKAAIDSYPLILIHR